MRLLREKVAYERCPTWRDPPSGNETPREPLPALRIQRVVAYAPAAARGVNDPATPGVDRYVADAPSGLGEHDQVAWSERRPDSTKPLA